jgi:hypothetical protein
MPGPLAGSPPPKDLRGRRFGWLVVVAFAGTGATGQGRRRAPRWLCRCGCGGEKVFKGVDLLAGRNKSCGCRQRLAAAESSRRNGIKFIRQRRKAGG